MFAVVLGVAAVGALAFAAYELLSKKSEPEQTPLSPNVYNAISKALEAGQPAQVGNVKLNPERVVACGVQTHDLADTEAWTQKRFGPQLPLSNRLDLMASAVPFPLWPTYARRIYCALKGK